MFENDTAFFTHSSYSRFQKIPTAKNTSSFSQDTKIKQTKKREYVKFTPWLLLIK